VSKVRGNFKGDNMNGNGGLEVQIFDYFIKHDDKNVRKLVLDTVEALAVKVRSQLNTISPFYQDFDIGNLASKADNCWVAFGPRKNKYRKWAHQTISINSQGIDIFVNIETKPATDRLKEKINEERQTFRKMILDLIFNLPLTIQVEERINRQASIYDYHLIARIESKYLKDPIVGLRSLEYLEYLLDKITFPYLTVRKHIDRDAVLNLLEKDRGNNLITHILNIMRSFHPFVKFINGTDFVV